MLEVITRPAVHAFGMSSSQRPTRRRSARLAFDDEEETRPAKKAKTGESAAAASAKPSTGRKTTTTSKKSKICKAYKERAVCTKAVCADYIKAYEEEADGFQFSRAKAKKPHVPASRTSPSKSSSQSASKDGQQQQATATTPAEAKQTAKPARATTSRGKKHAIPESQPAHEDDLPRRRSGRLSGDKVETLPRAESKSKATTKTTKTKAPLKEAKSPTSTPTEEARGEEPKAKQTAAEEPKGPTKIALPFADTPVIQRNKEMRKNSSTARRSSAGMRGRRASSLMDAGMSNGEH